MSKPPRSSMTMRDMLGAIGVLIVLALVIAGLGRACAFAPTGPQVDPNAVPVVDASARLDQLARDVPFPLRVPAVPADWRANSAGLDRVGDGSADRVVRVGYLTGERRFLRLMQSDVTEERLLRVVTGDRPVAGRGTVDVAGTRWVVYGGEDDEPIWIAEAGGARLLLTGSASEADFRLLAAAAVTAPFAAR